MTQVFLDVRLLSVHALEDTLTPTLALDVQVKAASGGVGMSINVSPDVSGPMRVEPLSLDAFLFWGPGGPELGWKGFVSAGYAETTQVGTLQVDGRLTVGQQGKVYANITAKEVVMSGVVEGLGLQRERWGMEQPDRDPEYSRGLHHGQTCERYLGVGGRDAGQIRLGKSLLQSVSEYIIYALFDFGLESSLNPL